MRQYVLKAVREAKLRTSWTEPDEAYEKVLLDFVAAIIDGPEDDPFLSDLSRLVARIAPIAQWNTLSRILLHLTIPGTPDIYQGDEAWNFALVDPDNRRPVNYTARQSSLGAVQAMQTPPSVGDVAGQFNTRTWVMHRILDARRKHPKLFAGEYKPLIVRGPRANHLVAFERRHEKQRALIVAPRLLGPILGTPSENDWTDTSIQLDDRLPKLACIFTGREPVVRDGRLEVSQSFKGIPFALVIPSEARDLH